MSEPDVKAIVERLCIKDRIYHFASDNVGTLVLRNPDGPEAAALISQLTTERDAAVKSADTAWDKCEDRRIEAHDNWLRAEAAEKRVKELEVERDALRDRLGYCYRRYAWAEN